MPRPRFALICGLPLALFLLGCPQGRSASRQLFREVGSEAGLRVPQPSGRSDHFYMPEIMGSGIAVFDFDHDGRLDLYLAHGRRLDGTEGTIRNEGRLYRNVSKAGSKDEPGLRFADVTVGSGIPAGDYGVGVATGDFDNDGLVDLYLTNYGPNRLLRNLGAGRFEDVTAKAGAGLDDDRWSTGASFLDFDQDGWLDLFVVNYLAATRSNHQICPTPAGEPDYCGPVTFKPETHRLLRNRGDGTFVDVSLESGVVAETGSGLGVIALDGDLDGRLDILVSNDKMPNFLWVQEPDGAFRESAMAAGCAVNIDGQPEAGMGVDAADVDGDGDEDLIFAHLTGETNTLYRNLGGAFEDYSLVSGLGPPSRPFTGFGAAFFDFDLDGWLDFAVANGHVHRLAALAEAGDPFPYDQRNQLFRNVGQGLFKEVEPAEAGAGFDQPAIHRGLAVGDLDNDGDLDLVLTRLDLAPLVLVNQLQPGTKWLGLRLRIGARDAYGASVSLSEPGAPLQIRRVRSDGSYISARDPRILLARRRDQPAAVDVTWPDGRRERFSGLANGRYHELVAGQGRSE